MVRRYLPIIASSLISVAFLSAAASFAAESEKAKLIDQPKPVSSSSSDSPAVTESGDQGKFNPLKISTEAEDINITFNANLAREQIKKFPDNPEAHFVLAVALTRSSQVEEAFKEIRISRRLAQNLGGPDYFDGMIQEYESMLSYYPDDIKVRYHLAWGYYMKAYLLAEYSKRVASANQKVAITSAKQPKAKDWHKEWVNSIVKPESAEGKNSDGDNASETPEESESDSKEKKAGRLIPMEQVMRKAAPSAVPKIKEYYESALRNLDELLVREPKDVWSRLYRAHLKAEYTGDLDSAMKVWTQVREENPNNPAAYFFIGEGYLKKGNLKECLTNVSKAIALRAIGN